MSKVNAAVQRRHLRVPRSAQKLGTAEAFYPRTNGTILAGYRNSLGGSSGFIAGLIFLSS